MPGAIKNSVGLDGFIWFIGVVEDRKDPEQLNRVRVRCFGWHTEDKEMVPTDTLKWAHPLQATNNPAAYQPKEGDMVFGFFLDGEFAQNPVIVGVLPGKPLKKPDYEKGFSDPNKVYPKNTNEPTVSRLSRGNKKGTVIETREKNRKKGVQSAGGVRWDEPAPYFKPKYGFNYAHESESKHAFELDDTEGAERVHLSHNKGSGFEIGPDGSRIEKIVKDNYTLVMGDDFIYVGGKCAVTIDGDCNLKIGGKFNVEAAEINLAATGGVKVKGTSGLQLESGSSMDLKSGSAMNIGAGGKASLSGSSAVVAGAKVDLTGGMVNVAGTATPGTPKETGLLGKAGGGLGGLGGALGALGAVASVVATGGLSAVASQVAGQVASQVAGQIAKGITGIATQSLSSAFSDINNQVQGGLKDLNSNLPSGELSAKMSTLENNINNSAESILELPPQQFSSLTGSIDNLVNTAAAKNISMNIDPRLKPQVPPTVSKIGKNLFPQTVTVPQTPGANT